MPALNWGLIQNGGVFESLMHSILYAVDPGTVLFGRPGKDGGQDGRSSDGTAVYQAKYRQNLDMDGAISLALEELEKITEYRKPSHANYKHWQSVRRWILVASFSVNPNDEAKWHSQVLPAFQKEGLATEYWNFETLEGKLAEHPEVRDVFFGEENRVLVGLNEAHDLLSAACVGSLSLDMPFVGREDELKTIREFVGSDDKRVLPIIGPGGIGKSRLLYESLVALSQDGWRVLWGLPGTMAKSSQWFKLLNGSQQTCVALDDPDDPNLLRVVIEQLSAVERRNWRVIIACRTEKGESLRRYRTNRWVHVALALPSLDESQSHSLVNSCLGHRVERSWLHSVFKLTKGVPGWLCLVAELTKQRRLHDLPSGADDIAGMYVDSCLRTVGQQRREEGLTLLRWISLWGTLSLDTDDAKQPEIAFLDSRGVPGGSFHNLLRTLVTSGLIRNWGVGKRLYAVEPLIVRQQILSNWLLRETAGTYEISGPGATLVSQLLDGEAPGLDSALRTLSQLARSRLADIDAVLFLSPIFREMARVAKEGSVLDQYRVLELVVKAGMADPESVLDVLVTIRENVKQSMDIQVPLWGRQSLTYPKLMSNVPWTLFQVAEAVSDQVVARRYIDEFRQLVALEDSGALVADAGKEPRQLVKRLLRRSNNAAVFGESAHDLASRELSDAQSWPFVGLLSECLLDPIRESMDWVSNWTIAFARRAVLPGSGEWGLATDLRAQMHHILKTAPHAQHCPGMWKVLAESHHSLHREVLHGAVKGAASAGYCSVLVEDLKTCVGVLSSPAGDLSLEEAISARQMWKWYLKYGKEDELVGLARQCEKYYNELSPWRVHDFFRVDIDSELAPETERVARLLREASSPSRFTEFFDEAHRFLAATRQGGQDMADDWRISALAEQLADDFDLDGADANPLTAFVVNMLGQAEPENPIAWGFAVGMCRRHLLAARNTSEAAVSDRLRQCLKIASAKDRLLWGVYSNVHPISTGVLTKAELDTVLVHELEFKGHELFFLLGGFITVDTQQVQSRLRKRLEDIRDDVVEAGNCLGSFIRAAYVTALLYNCPPEQVPVRWIIDAIADLRLDGSLLGSRDLEWMREHTGFRLTMPELTQLMQSRIELEGQPKPHDRFEIVPHDFDVGQLCDFDATAHAEVNAFYEFCRMALGSSFTAIYWMPRYIAQLDPSGQHVAEFIAQHLRDDPNISGKALARLGYLASAYPEDSVAWATIAAPICTKAQSMPRDTRKGVYFGLTTKETDVISSMPGEVPEYYVRVRETAARLLENEPASSPLHGFREWKLRGAQEDLRREEEAAEEDDNG